MSKRLLRLVKPKTRSERAVSGLSVGTLASGLSMVIGLVLTPVILKFVGSEGYGVWAVIGQFVGLAAMAEIGVGSGVQTYYSRMEGASEAEELQGLVGAGLAMQLGFSVLLIAVALGFSWWLPTFVNSDVFGERYLLGVFFGAVVVRAVAFPLEVPGQVLNGTQRMHLSFTIGLFRNLLKAISIVGFLYLGLGLFALPFGSLLALLIAGACTILVVRRVNPSLSWRVWPINILWIKKLLKFGGWGLLARLGGRIIYNSDNLLITYFMGPSSVSVYVITRKLFELLRQNLYRIGNVLRPGVANAIGNGETKVIREVFFKVFRAYLLVGCPALVVVSFGVERFTGLWVGPDLYGGKLLVGATAGSVLMLLAYHAGSVFLIGALEVKPIAISRTSEAGLNLLLSVTFLKLGFGLGGVAAGTFLACAGTSGVRIPYRAAQQIGIGLAEVARRIIGPVGIAGTATLGVCFALSRVRVFSCETWFSLLAFVGLASVLAGMAVYGLCLGREERRTTIRLLGFTE